MPAKARHTNDEKRVTNDSEKLLFGDSRRPLKAAMQPWALSPDDRRACFHFRRALTHEARITAGGRQVVARIRDTSLARSDRHLANPDDVEISRSPNRRGFLTHRVRTAAGWKLVFENTKTGAFTMGGRARRFDFGLTWNPPPPIISVMRAKIPPVIELLSSPTVPMPRRAQAARPLRLEDLQIEPEPGRPKEHRSTAAREHHAANFVFMTDGGQ